MAYLELGTTGKNYVGSALLDDLQQLVPALQERAGEADALLHAAAERPNEGALLFS